MTDIIRNQMSQNKRSTEPHPPEPLGKLIEALKESGMSPHISDSDVIGCPQISYKRKKVAIFVEDEKNHGHRWLKPNRALKVDE